MGWFVVLPSIAVTVDATRNVYLLQRICCVLTNYLNISHSGPSHYLVSPCFTGGTAITAPATALDAAASCALCAFGRCGWRCPLPPQTADRCYHATRSWGKKKWLETIWIREILLRIVLGIPHCIPLLLVLACYMFDLAKISKLEAELCVLLRIYGSKSTQQQSN